MVYSPRLFAEIFMLEVLISCRYRQVLCPRRSIRTLIPRHSCRQRPPRKIPLPPPPPPLLLLCSRQPPQGRTRQARISSSKVACRMVPRKRNAQRWPLRHPEGILLRELLSLIPLSAIHRRREVPFLSGIYSTECLALIRPASRI